MPQGVCKQIRAIPPIKPKAHLFEIGGKVLSADLMPRSDNSTLQKRKRGLDRIRMDVGSKADILTSAMVDRFVFHVANCFRVGAELVSNNDVNIGADVLLNVLRQRSRLDIFGTEETEISPALPDADDDLFVVQLSRSALAAILSAYVGLVYLDSAVKHRLIRFDHRVTDAMAEIPRGFITDSERPLKLIGRHAFACFHKKQDGEKPRFERKMGIVEDRLSRNAELVVTLRALEFLLRCYLEYVAALASQALDPERPAQPFQKLTATVIGPKHPVNINQGHD